MEHNVKSKSSKNCLLCGRPLRVDAEICIPCAKQRKKLNKWIIDEKHWEHGIGTNLLLYMMHKYGVRDIFAFIHTNPSIINSVFDMDSRTLGTERKEQTRVYYEEHEEIQKDEEPPIYIETLLGEDKSLLGISGKRSNPLIHYQCKKCGKTYQKLYFDMSGKQYHRCDKDKSTGERAVADYLKEKEIDFCSEYGTLKCVNPLTGHVMPYDFEIIGRKILIEVQGDQHKKYVDEIQTSPDQFEYQRAKDQYKKKFAKECGYQLLEIWYEQIQDGSFKSIIDQAVGI